MSKIYAGMAGKDASMTGRLPTNIDRLTYDMVKVNIDRNDSTTTPCIVAFDRNTLYLIEQSPWQPLTMRVDLCLLKKAVEKNINGEGWLPSDTESDPVICDYYSTGHDFKGKKLDHPAGWYEPQRKAHRFSFSPSGALELRVDAPEGKNKVFRYVRLSDSISVLLRKLIGESEMVNKPGTVPNVTAATETELAIVAKFA